MKKKVYISLPITGYDIEERKRVADSAKARARAMGCEAITPFDVCPEEGKPYAYYMGRDIEALLGCDIIYLCKGWEHSKGCCAEAAIATIYKIKKIKQ